MEIPNPTQVNNMESHFNEAAFPKCTITYGGKETPLSFLWTQECILS